MSAFENKETTEVEPEDYLAELVGEGRKFKDEKELAKGKWEADKHIKSLERQLAEMREDLDKTSKIDELLELVRSQKKASVPNGEDEDGLGKDGDPNDTSSDQFTDEQIKALIKGQLNEYEATTRRSKNVADVKQELNKRFGDRANSVVQSRADELGMTLDEMEEMAGNRPKAFLQLVVGSDKGRDSSSLVGGGVRSEAGKGRNADVRNFAYYNEMRRKNKKLYYSPEIQMQLMKDAQTMGEAFYNN